MLGDPTKPEEYQEWTIQNLTASWQDFYLPINKAKANASQVKIKFEPVDPNFSPALYVDNVTFTATRPPAVKDWLDRMLTEENVLSEVHSERTQTLAQYLGLREAADPTGFDWNQLLTAETRIEFNAEGEAREFQTLYGSVSKIGNGAVTETLLPNGNKIQFESPSAVNPQAATQTVTQSNGSIETLQLNYGRVRTVSRPTGSALQYSYEFASDGKEITVVRDPDSGITERYGAAVPQGAAQQSPKGAEETF